MSDEPYAEITRMGRWLHYITVHYGMIELSPGWFAYGRRHAERKAARVLRRYLVAEGRRQNPVRITRCDAGTGTNPYETWLPAGTDARTPGPGAKDGHDG